MGNGFSRACRDDIFAYSALFDRADFGGLPPSARAAFDALGTTDFETVIRGLQSAATVLSCYHDFPPAVIQQLQTDALGLRDVLVKSIADSHPARPSDISPRQYAACKQFLSNFDGLYSLNYDLLLYWALMQSEIAPQVRCDDGFRKPEGEEAAYVTWEPDNVHGQNVHYLHGALHLFDSGSEIQKYTWSNTGIALID